MKVNPPVIMFTDKMTFTRKPEGMCSFPGGSSRTACTKFWLIFQRKVENVTFLANFQVGETFFFEIQTRLGRRF